MTESDSEERTTSGHSEAKLKGSLEENVLTALVAIDSLAVDVAELVQPRDFYTPSWQKIAEAAIKYIKQYQKPPGVMHMRDLLEKDLRINEDPDELLKFALDNIENILPHCLPEFIKDKLHEFVEHRRIDRAIIDSTKANRKYDINGAYSALQDALDKRDSVPWIARQTLPTVANVMTKEFGEMRWVVNSYVPEGVALIAGPPKIGKSLLVLNIALAAVTGGRVLGQEVQPTSVLSISLEDNERRLQARLASMLVGESLRDTQQQIYYQFDVPNLDDGLLPRIGHWLNQYPDIRLVTLDPWGMVRGQLKPNEKEYAYDVRMMKKLVQFSQTRGVSFLVVHHTVKQTSSDALLEVGGTHGLTGSADTILVLSRETEPYSARLRAKGRDLIDEHDLMVQRDKDTGIWSVLGNYSESTPEKRETLAAKILALLTENGPMRYDDIARSLFASDTVVKVTLGRMNKKGAVESNGKGTWAAVEAKSDDVPASS